MDITLVNLNCGIECLPINMFFRINQDLMVVILSTFQKEYLQTGYIPTDNDGIQRERPIDFDSP